MQFTSTYLLRFLFPSLHWNIKTSEKTIYLTFDDGPHPEITTKVLRILEEKKARATFFCVGDNVNKYPETYQQILEAGHRTANHGYNHLNGWKTPDHIYVNNVQQCRTLVDSDLFRPPYGRIKSSQIKMLKRDYRIIMWSIITYDFSKKVSKEQCLKNSIKFTKPGTIIVFHDSLKAADNMLYALPKCIDHFKAEGYRFEVL